jgi:hypothetical protein
MPRPIDLWVRCHIVSREEGFMTRVIGLGLVLLAGCASAPPTGALTAASAAIGAAHEAGAADAPAAKEQLAMAREEFDQARALIDEGDHRGAYGLLVRSKADADLATARSREESLRREAEQLARRAEALRTQTQF